MKYTDDQLQQLIKDIHDGKITDREMPVDLYEAVAGYLKKALYEGFGKDITEASGESLTNLLDLRENIYLFSGAKTFQFIKEATGLLTDENGVLKSFSQYKAQAEALYDKYNVNWLAAEYKTTVGQAQMATRWNDIQKNKDILSMLRFSTNGHACPICDPFEGLTKPADDPVWKIASPLMHFGCFCILESHDNETEESDQAFMNSIAPNLEAIPELFRNNPGITGEVFNKSHPYFDVPKEDKKFAKNNFNLPVPHNDGKPVDDIASRIDYIKKNAGGLVNKSEKKIIDGNESKITDLRKDLKDMLPALEKAKADLNFDSYKELTDRYNGKVYQIQDLRKEIQVYKDKYAERAAQLLKSPSSGTMSLTGGTSENIKRGRDIFKSIVGDNTALQNKILKVKIQEGRAGYNTSKDVMLLRKDTPLSTVAHEMGHWLETKDVQYFAKVKDFYDKRTAGESVKYLNELKPGKGYGANEIVKEDKFWNSYTGKLYTDQRVGLMSLNKSKQFATEITPMWFTHSLEDLAGFIKNDPEHFEFIYKLLNQ